MKIEQFNQLQAICTLDGLCYSLHETAEELEDAVEILQMRLRSFRATVEAYGIAHKDIYIDKED